ncbi:MULTISPECIES: ABC transporter permease [Streptomyces]|uniref:ABC transporter permease n=1 Tax=Streptomyces caniscabiei TaxID=2746961 RepID=A0ABU4MYK0_9ACTN|nr:MULTISPECIES: ABC transporter permease [Streptomyces]MBE4733378.1 ABC transporter permease [Streptomyces caniscabiei]MBE4754556.1 ABC transporter permease [Streptomyces caniscabiei]MBE4768623.1 ABC transporter permease [Streptomyces caniscabiei]MBE4781873.1 ABC transporter permease [Streptomyces caniscabiei]MBE4793163.1 ABC transporter permease [Streptomyces caniscabiei]
MTSTPTRPAALRPPAPHRHPGLVPAAPVRRAVAALSFRNIGAVYVWLVIAVLFSVWAPETFPTVTTVKQVLNGNAVAGLVALSVVPPLAARVFDLSVAYTMSLTSVLTAYFLVTAGLGPSAAIALAMTAALLIGVVNGVVVVVLRVDSFIATLATGALIQSLITMVTNDSSITGVQLLAEPFASIAQLDAGGITLPVLYLLLAAVAIWFLLEHTATGRRLYATGFNADAARLQGVRTDRLRFLTLVTSALLSGAAGVVFASAVGSGSPTAGTPYLLSAYAAAFVGATQLRAGRFNAWGTVLAVLLLGTGVTGLGLATSAPWAASLFTGSVLIVALVLTGGRITLPAVLRRRTGNPSGVTPAPPTEGAAAPAPSKEIEE